MSARHRALALVLIASFLVAGCGSTEPTATPVPATATRIAVGATNTSQLPTDTPVPPAPTQTPVPPSVTATVPTPTAAAPAATVPPASVAPERCTGSIPECAQAYLETLDARAEFSGAVLVAQDGEPVFKGAYGLANRALGIPNQIDTKFNLGSMDKMFTAVAILQLVEQGKLSLDAKVADVLPDYPNQQVAKAVTIHQLLTHTSGMGDWSESPRFPDLHEQIRAVEDYLPLFVDTPLEFEPGDRFRYSNSGYIVLGLIIEELVGQSYYDHVRTSVFEPCGMTDTAAYELDAAVPDLAVGYTRLAIDGSELDEITDYRFAMPMKGGPSGGGFSTVEDLLRFQNALLDHRLLSPEMTEMLLAGKVRLNDSAQYAYGFIDRMVENQRVVGHSGGAPGVCSYVNSYLDQGYTLIVLSNSDSDCLAAFEAIQGVLLSIPSKATPTPTATATPMPAATEAPGFTLVPEPNIRVDARTYGGRLTDWGYDILLLDDGGTLIVGHAENTGPSHRISSGKARLIRTDADGNVVWQKDYGGDVDAMFYCPIQTGDDEYVILGQIAASYVRDEEDIYLVKIDGQGNEIWSQTYGGQGMDAGKMIRQTSDGGFIVVGDRADEFPRGGLYQSDLVLIKTDAEGNEVWTRTYGEEILYLGWGVAQTPDGGYVLAGWEAKTIPDRDVIALKVDESGEVEWSRTWDLDPGDRDGGFDLILTADGHVVIAGIASMDDGPRRAVLIKVDLEGNEVWVKEYDAGGEGSEFWDIMEETDGGYVMAGGRFLTPIDRATGEAVREGFIVKTDPEGEVLWQHTVGSSDYESTLLSSAVTLPGRGYIFIGGARPNGQKYWDMLWLKLETGGTQLSATAGPVSTTPTDASLVEAISVDTVDQLELLSTLSGHNDHVYGLAFSGDGSQLASSSADKTIRSWDVASGQVGHTFSIREVTFNAIALSPDGRLLASAQAIWDVESGQMIHALSQAPGSVAFSPDGSILAAAGPEQPIKLWDVTSGQVAYTLDNETVDVTHDIDFSPDGTRLAIGGHRYDGTVVHGMVTVWQVQNGQFMPSFEQEVSEGIHSVAFSPDGHLLASAGTEGTTGLWDVTAGQAVHTLHGNGCYDVAFSADGSLLATAGCDLTVKLWEVTSGRLVRTLPHGCEVVSVVFSPDGTLLAAGGYDHQIHLWGVPR